MIMEERIQQLLTEVKAYLARDKKDVETFRQMIEEADEVCPVSNLLRNGLEIQIDATLLQDDSYKEGTVNP